jgi:hypothetical protein
MTITLPDDLAISIARESSLQPSPGAPFLLEARHVQETRMVHYNPHQKTDWEFTWASLLSYA